MMWLQVTSIALSIIAVGVSLVTAYYSFWPKPRLSATLTLCEEQGEILGVYLSIHNNGRRAANLVTSGVYWESKKEYTHKCSWLRRLQPYDTATVTVGGLERDYYRPFARKDGGEKPKLHVDIGEGLQEVPLDFVRTGRRAEE